jgi:hypothetical protein
VLKLCDIELKCNRKFLHGPNLAAGTPWEAGEEDVGLTMEGCLLYWARLYGMIREGLKGNQTSIEEERFFAPAKIHFHHGWGSFVFG